jgi:hypothetical protein
MMHDISDSSYIGSNHRNTPFSPFAVLAAVAVAAGATWYVARPSGRPATPARRRLIAYLLDHLGGSDVAIPIVRHLAETYDGTPDGALCRRLAKEFDEDRSVVRSLLTQLGASDRSIKRAAGYASGSLLRVAAGGQPGDLSLLRTLEGLAIGVQGKRCLWRALQALHTLPSTIDRMSVVDLEAKAVRQWEAIEQRRLAVVARTFSASAE